MMSQLNMRHGLVFFFFIVFSSLGISEEMVESPIQRERDAILMLLAYSTAYLNWVSPQDQNKRGYNIAAVLYDPQQEKIVGVQRNAVDLCGDKTQHAEVRLIQQCINTDCRGKGNHSLKGTTIYTTLEPCMMCGGMMVFLEVSRVVFGQADQKFGKNIERLQQNFRTDCEYMAQPEEPSVNSCKVDIPANYRALKILVEPSQLLKRAQLDGAFAIHQLLLGSAITEFLMSVEAHEIFQKAHQQLKSYKPKYRENMSILMQAHQFLEKLTRAPGEIDRCFMKQSHNH
ncbi:nucleoside deaminase [Microbulbifer variabilis]|uniref:nucleoside deaminase n=1 Tax=Microbulbifer variabilis TaxID=266805 RepID=UPI001CFEE003|nr:nucleoside deaminase [Microbulbifer variabilis]